MLKSKSNITKADRALDMESKVDRNSYEWPCGRPH